MGSSEGVLALLRGSGAALTAGEVARATGGSPHAARLTLIRLLARDQVERVGWGKYRARPGPYPLLPEQSVAVPWQGGAEAPESDLGAATTPPAQVTPTDDLAGGGVLVLTDEVAAMLQAIMLATCWSANEVIGEALRHYLGDPEGDLGDEPGEIVRAVCRALVELEDDAEFGVIVDAGEGRLDTLAERVSRARPLLDGIPAFRRVAVPVG